MNPSNPPGSSLPAIAKAAAETAPPVGLAAWHFLLNQPIEKWLTAFAILYTVLQIVVLVRKEFLKRGGKRK